MESRFEQLGRGRRLGGAISPEQATLVDPGDRLPGIGEGDRNSAIAKRKLGDRAIRRTARPAPRVGRPDLEVRLRSAGNLLGARALPGAPASAAPTARRGSPGRGPLRKWEVSPPGGPGASRGSRRRRSDECVPHSARTPAIPRRSPPAATTRSALSAPRRRRPEISLPAPSGFRRRASTKSQGGSPS